MLTTTGNNGTFDSNGYTLTLNAALAGPGGLQKIGAGTLVVTAFNNYSGDTTVSAGSLQISGGQLPAVNEYVGGDGPASVVLSSGKNLVSGTLVLGIVPAGGSYYLSPGGLLSAADESVGNYGPGMFAQTGGTNNVSSLLSLGVGSASTGTYNLSGGQLSATGETVGYSLTSVGNVTQTGGTNSVSSNLTIGSNGSGTYTLGGGSLAALVEYIGYSATGIFTQSGGTHSVPSILWLGHNANTGGTYTLSGSGLLAVANELIGYSGSGTVTQTGGIHTVTADFALGVNTSGVGTYNLSGSGQLSSSSDEQIGLNGTGYFTQFGGTNAASSNLWLGQYSTGYGTYYLANTGQLTVANTEYVGYQGTGIFTQVGGTNSVGTLELAYSNGSTGSYNLSGGLLHLSSLTRGSGAATFDFTGGTFQAATSFATSVPMDFLQQGYTSTFDTNGSTLTLNGALSGPGGMQKGGAGTLILAAANTYGGPTTLNAGMLEVANGNSGSATGSNAVTLNGGVLAAGSAGGTVLGAVYAGNAPHTIAPGAALSSGYGTLNLNGGLATNNYTKLLFNLNFATSMGTGSNGVKIYGGDLINFNGGAINIGGGQIALLNTPTQTGDYRLFDDATLPGGAASLSDFTLPNQSGTSYVLSTAVELGLHRPRGGRRQRRRQRRDLDL